MEFLFDHQIADDHGKQRRDGRGDQAEHEGVPEGLQAAVFEHVLEVLQGQGVIPAPELKQRAKGNADVHQHHKGGEKPAQDGQGTGHALVRDEHPFPAGLAGQGGVGALFQIVFLNQEQHQRQAQQHHGHGAGARLVVSAGDLQVDGGGQRVVAAADHHGVGEVGHGFDERDQKRVAKARQHQGQGHGGEDLPPAGPHVPAGFFQRRVDVFQKALEHHVAYGEEGQNLHDGNAVQAVDVAVIDVQQAAGDETAAAEEQDHAQAQHEGRRDHGQHTDHIEEPAHEAGADVYIHVHIGEQKSQHRGADAHDETQAEGIGKSRAEGAHFQHPAEHGQGQAVVAPNAVDQQHTQGIENE